jgi:hypothetical protein
MAIRTELQAQDESRQQEQKIIIQKHRRELEAK